jgi:hypothetical protein
MGESGMKAASRRAVLKTARIGANTIKAATREAMYDHPGGYAPYKAANFKRPKVRSRGGSISAGAGYTQEGSFVRFRSTGTSTGEQGFGMTQKAAALLDAYLLRADTEARVRQMEAS